MSLLTEEQIAELACIASNQSTSKDLYDEFHEWNEKQIPSTQFEPDWNYAPSNATSVYLKAIWYDREMMEADRTTICGWGRPVTPHPHAGMIMKYAEVAQRRADPWVEFAYRRNINDDWKKLDNYPAFGITYEYRHIGETK